MARTARSSTTAAAAAGPSGPLGLAARALAPLASLARSLRGHGPRAIVEQFRDRDAEPTPLFVDGPDDAMDRERERLVWLSRLHARARGDLYGTGIQRLIDYAIPCGGVRPIGLSEPARRAAAWFADTADDAMALDAAGLLDLQGWQEMLLRHYLIDGEIAVSRTMEGSTQLLACERIGSLTPIAAGVPGFVRDWIAAHPRYSRSIDADHCRVRDGVVTDGARKPIAYLLWGYDAQDRVDRTATPIILDAAHVWHEAHREHAGQTRGLPPFLAALRRSANSGRYDEATVKSATLQANIPIAIQSAADPGTVSMGLPGAASSHPDHDERDEMYGSGGATAGTVRSMLAEGVHVLLLDRGDTLSALPSSQPGTGYEPYMARQLRSVSGRFGLAAELLGLDFSSASYSSARLAVRLSWPVVKRAWRVVQRTTAWVYAWRVRRAIAEGVLRGVDPAEAMRVRWSAMPMPSADPRQELLGVVSGIQAGLTDPGQYLSEQGLSLEEVADGLSAYYGAMERRGVPIIGLPGSITQIDRSGIAYPSQPEPTDASPTEPTPTAPGATP